MKLFAGIIKIVRWYLQEIFSLDLRSLAFLRVGTGIMILADLILRSRDFVEFYTDQGVLPHKVAFESLAPWNLSIHVLNGTWQYEAVLFVIAGIFAVMLIAGYKTRLATVVSWILLLSLQQRNMLVNAADDVILRMLLFWGMFLPWQAYYSVDSLKKKYIIPNKKRIATIATAAFLLQVCMIYWSAYLLKNSPEWKTNFTAVYYALNLEQMSTSLAKLLLHFPPLLTLLTILTISMEGFLAFVFFIPWKQPIIRTIAVTLFIFMHIGFGTNLNIGLFPIICIVMLFGLYPGFFWDTLWGFFKLRKKQAVTLYYDGLCGFCRNSVYAFKTFLILPEGQILPAQKNAKALSLMQRESSWVIEDTKGEFHTRYDGFLTLIEASPLLFWLKPVFALFSFIGNPVYHFVSLHRKVACSLTPPTLQTQEVAHLGFIPSILAYFFLLYVALWNISSVPNSTVQVPQQIQWVAGLTRVDQYWAMFAPYPLKVDGWYVIPAQLADGKTVDLFNHGKPVTFQKPPDISVLYANYRIRKYFEHLFQGTDLTDLRLYSQYLCTSWNSSHPIQDHVLTFIIYFMNKTTLPDYQKPHVIKQQLYNYTCGTL